MVISMVLDMVSETCPSVRAAPTRLGQSGSRGALVILFLLVVLGASASTAAAQYGHKSLWQVPGRTGTLILCDTGNADLDAGAEVLLAWADEDAVFTRLFLVDAATGDLEWSLGRAEFAQIYVGEAEGAVRGSPRFAPRLEDIDADGLDEILFTGVQYQGSDLAGFFVREFTLPAPGSSAEEAGSTVTATLASAAEVTLVVYDLAGGRMRTVEFGRLPAGKHDLVWDGQTEGGAELPAGTYFCEIRLDGEPEGNRRVVVLP